MLHKVDPLNQLNNTELSDALKDRKIEEEIERKRKIKNVRDRRKKYG